ncbi:MAG: Ig-like domain-containing protein [Sphingobacteriales bacterium]|nr:MAG: Ig-like domain-containing protein [Sphingobacteriales bacterium]
MYLLKLTIFLSFLISSVLYPTPVEAQTLNSDFMPCICSGAGGIGNNRLMIATSNNAMNWTKINMVLSDRASVADAIVLSNGRVLVYFMAGCQVIGGSTQNINQIKMAISLNNGATWAYKNVSFTGLPVGANLPVDPNLTVLPDGSMNMLAMMSVSGDLQVHTFRSTDGGFTYQYEGLAFSVSGQTLFDPENFRFDTGNWQIYTGNLTLNNTQKGISTNGMPFFDNLGTFCSAVSAIPPDCYVVADITEIGGGVYKMYAFGNAGVTGDAIVSLHSSNAGTSWLLESGLRLQLSVPSSLESVKVATPTVVRTSAGQFMMVYETIIPASVCSEVMTALNITPLSFTGSAAINDTVRFSANGTFSDGAIRNLTSFALWQSSNPLVATILPNGAVKALSAGTTQITATHNGQTSNIFILNVTGGGGSGNGPWNGDLVICESADGTSFNNCRLFVDSAGVVSVIQKPNGDLIAAFQWFPAPIGSPFWDKVAISTSSDHGINWTYPVAAQFPDLPSNYQRPFDPTLALTENGNIRMYFSSSGNGTGPLNETVHTYSAISTDGGWTYTFEPGIRFQYPGQPSIDPAVVRHNGLWYYSSPAGAPQDGAHRAVSEDGLNFTQLEDIPSDTQHNWTGNLISLPGELRFYGSGGTLWWSSSTNGGDSWNGYIHTNLKGGDPAVVKTGENQYLIIFTGFRCTSPPILSGNNTACGGNTQTYSVSPSTGAQYFWSVSGGNIISGQGTSEITVLWYAGSGVGQVGVLQMN